MRIYEDWEKNPSPYLYAGNIGSKCSKEVVDTLSVHKSRDYLHRKTQKRNPYFLYASHMGSRYFYVNKIFEKIVIVGNEIVQIDNR